MTYTYSLPASMSFTGKGLLGYSFGPLNQKDLEIYYIEVEKGHDTFMVSKRITRTYYVRSGNGYGTKSCVAFACLSVITNPVYVWGNTGTRNYNTIGYFDNTNACGDGLSSSSVILAGRSNFGARFTCLFNY